MSITVPEIKDLKEHLVNTYHANRVTQQQIDETYINDTFQVPFIKKGVNAIRTGKGYRMCSTPAEHIITSNPQLFRKTQKETAGEKDKADRIGVEGNRWLRVLTRQSPQPFKQFIKHILGRGEGWIYLQHNNHFDPDDLNSLPVDFTIPDPLVIFGDRTEWNGIPERVIVSYDRSVSNLHATYPEWILDDKDKKKTKFPFFMYYDKDVRYFEANAQALLRDEEGNLSNGDGIQENVYKLVPFVHAYSGFGLGSVDGDPASYAVGRLRYCRDLIAEYTAMNSTVDSIIFKYAHKSIDLFYPAGGPAPSGDVGEKYSREPNAFNMVGLPEGAKMEVAEEMLPGPELFGYLHDKERLIDKEDPLGLTSTAMGTSGRQQDMVEESSLRRYDTVVENCAAAFATAFGSALRIVEKLEGILPSTLKKDDINGYYEVSIELKAEDALALDRLRTLGSRLYQQGEIDLETNLTKYQGYTQEEAKLIMARILADNATRNNPVIAAIMGEQAAREIGMEEQARVFKEQGLKENTLPGIPQIGSQGGPPRTGNIQTPTGQQMPDMSLAQKGARMSPQ